MTRPENMFDEAYTYVQYDRDCGITAVYFNPDGGLHDAGVFMEHYFPMGYLLENADKDFDDDFLFGDAFHCPTNCYDFGEPCFAGMVESLLTEDWIEMGATEVVPFVKGVIAAVRSARK